MPLARLSGSGLEEEVRCALWSGWTADFLVRLLLGGSWSWRWAEQKLVAGMRSKMNIFR
jgi:hypothetical protein